MTEVRRPYERIEVLAINIGVTAIAFGLVAGFIYPVANQIGTSFSLVASIFGATSAVVWKIRTTIRERVNMLLNKQESS